MNWKKWIKYAFIAFIVLTIISFIYMNRQGKLMYGGLTERVDYEQFKPDTGPLAIKNVNVLSPDSERFIPGQTVLIENGLIKGIDSLSDISGNYSIVDGSGKYLIPGLIDAHVHLFQSPNDLLLYVANGVTEIRELIGEEDHLDWKKQIEEGRIGPKMFVASPRLGSFGALEGWFMSWSQGYMNIENAADAKKSITELYNKGYDGIKIYSQLNKESYLAIMETTKSLGMPAFGHIPWSLSLEDIWQNGQNDIAHFEELMNALQREFDPSYGSQFGSFYGKEEDFLKYVNERSDALADNLNRNNITVTSTLWLTQTFLRQKFDLEQLLSEVELAYENPGISEWVPYIPHGLGWLPNVNRYKLNEDLTEEKYASHKKYWGTYGEACKLLATNLSKRGVKIMAGTDANLPPTVPGFSLHDELQSLNQSGMSTAQVLQSATSNPAEWLKSNSGKIVTGYDANMVLLDKNPLDQIENTKSINSVILKGQLLDRSLLDNILSSVKKANDKSRKVNIDSF